jgi:hypothetical protein
MLALFAKAKGTTPPDINARLKNNPILWDLVRDVLDVASDEEQVMCIKQQLQLIRK